MKFKEFTVQYKESKDTNNGVICGYASTWDEVPDAYGDIVKKGAFENSLRKIYESGRTIPFLWSHRMDDLDAYLGTCEAHEDDKGLYFEATLDDTPQAQRVRELFKDGRLSKFSFAYNIIEEQPITLENGVKANQLVEVEIFEITACLVPANSFAEVTDVKSDKGSNIKSNEDIIKEAISLLTQLVNEDTSEEESNSEDNSEVNDEQSEEQKNIVNEVKSTEEQKKLLDIINNM